jgi:hypothetical protein
MFSLGGSRVAIEVSVEHRLWLQDNTKLVTYRVVNGSEITLQVIFTIGIIGKKKYKFLNSILININSDIFIKKILLYKENNHTKNSISVVNFLCIPLKKKRRNFTI